jgi:hypothetical protein
MSFMTVRSRWAAVLAVAALAAISTSGTAAAAPATAEPWEPWQQQEWSAPAGRYCDFAFHIEVVSQDIERRTLSRFDDGTIRYEQYRGPLISDFVRDDTGASVRENSSGELFMEYYADGTVKTMTTIGPVGAGFGEADDVPRGYYNLDGVHVISAGPDGVKRMAVDAGDETDVCAQLT